MRLSPISSPIISWHRESDPGPPHYQCDALPTEPCQHILFRPFRNRSFDRVLCQTQKEYYHSTGRLASQNFQIICESFQRKCVLLSDKLEQFCDCRMRRSRAFPMSFALWKQDIHADILTHRLWKQEMAPVKKSVLRKCSGICLRLCCEVRKEYAHPTARSRRKK